MQAYEKHTNLAYGIGTNPQSYGWALDLNIRRMKGFKDAETFHCKADANEGVTENWTTLLCSESSLTIYAHFKRKHSEVQLSVFNLRQAKDKRFRTK